MMRLRCNTREEDVAATTGGESSLCGNGVQCVVTSQQLHHPYTSTPQVVSRTETEETGIVALAIQETDGLKKRTPVDIWLPILTIEPRFGVLLHRAAAAGCRGRAGRGGAVQGDLFRFTIPLNCYRLCQAIQKSAELAVIQGLCRSSVRIFPRKEFCHKNHRN